MIQSRLKNCNIVQIMSFKIGCTPDIKLIFLLTRRGQKNQLVQVWVSSYVAYNFSFQQPSKHTVLILDITNPENFYFTYTLFFHVHGIYSSWLGSG